MRPQGGHITFRHGQVLLHGLTFAEAQALYKDVPAPSTAPVAAPEPEELLLFEGELIEVAAGHGLSCSTAGDALNSLRPCLDPKLCSALRNTLRARGYMAHPLPTGRCKRLLCEVRAALADQVASPRRVSAGQPYALGDVASSHASPGKCVFHDISDSHGECDEQVLDKPSAVQSEITADLAKLHTKVDTFARELDQRFSELVAAICKFPFRYEASKPREHKNEHDIVPHQHKQQLDLDRPTDGCNIAPQGHKHEQALEPRVIDDTFLPLTPQQQQQQQQNQQPRDVLFDDAIRHLADLRTRAEALAAEGHEVHFVIGGDVTS